MSTFDQVSAQYQQHALVQQAAAEKLLGLLKIAPTEDVLDVACGPGHITQQIRSRTRGRVIGTDISAGMIAQAQANYPAIDFRRLAAETLDYRQAFDVVFCNSSLQWFTRPSDAVAAMRMALRPGGRMGVSCPATENWSTCFKGVAEEAGAHSDLRSTFARWRSPWFYLPDEESYRKLFETGGFQTSHCRIELEARDYDVEQAIAVFSSGAGQGYTGREFYDVPISDDYVGLFKAQLREAMVKRARGGKVNVDFRRLYYVGVA